MKNSKFVRSAAFAVALLLGGAGMTGTAFARPNTGHSPEQQAKAKSKGCMWNGVAANNGDVESKTVHHADGSSEVHDYTCTNGTWVQS